MQGFWNQHFQTNTKIETWETWDKVASLISKAGANHSPVDLYRGCGKFETSCSCYWRQIIVIRRLEIWLQQSSLCHDQYPWSITPDILMFHVITNYD